MRETFWIDLIFYLSIYIVFLGTTATQLGLVDSIGIIAAGLLIFALLAVIAIPKCLRLPA